MSQFDLSELTKSTVIIMLRTVSPKKQLFTFSIMKDMQSKHKIHFTSASTKVSGNESFNTVLTTLKKILTNPPVELKLLLLIQYLKVLLIQNNFSKPYEHSNAVQQLKVFESMTTSVKRLTPENEAANEKLINEKFNDVQWPGPSNIPFIFIPDLFEPDIFPQVPEVDPETEYNVFIIKPKKEFPESVTISVKTHIIRWSEESGLPLEKVKQIYNKKNQRSYDYNPPEYYIVQFNNLQLAIDYFASVSLLGGKGRKNKKGGTRKNKKSKKLSRKRRNYK